MKVLIVDDEPLIRRSLGRALRNSKHQVVEAEDGLIGYQKWSSEEFSIVFLDVLMPGMTGPQLIAKMKDQHKSIVVLMSAFSGEHNMETALQMGAHLFIPKPFEDIFSVVRLAEALIEEKVK